MPDDRVSRAGRALLAAAAAALVAVPGCVDTLNIGLGDPLPGFAVHGLDGAPVTDGLLRGHVALLHLVNPARASANESAAFVRQARGELAGEPVTFLTVAWDARGTAKTEAQLRAALAALLPGANWTLATNTGDDPLTQKGNLEPVEVLLFDRDGTLRARTPTFHDPSCIVRSARELVAGTFEGLLHC